MSDETVPKIFREVNERIAEITGTWEWEDEQGFLCECVRNDCVESILLSQADYEAVRADPAHFFTLPGHERADQERVVERHEAFVVVEKLLAIGVQSAEDVRTG